MPPIRQNKNTQLELIADRFGGFAPFARMLGLVPCTVRCWQLRRGGRIPEKYHDAIRAAAKKRGVRVTRAELAG